MATFELWFKAIQSCGPWRWKWQPTLVFLPGKFHGTEEPGRLQSMDSQKVRHDLATKPPTTTTCASAGKEPACDAGDLGSPACDAGDLGSPACDVGDLGSVPELGRSPGAGKGYPLHCSGLDSSLMSNPALLPPWTFKAMGNCPCVFLGTILLVHLL